MRIQEVEALVGVTRKNIRFYEEQGLLSPGRNAENRYRDYGPEEVEQLRRIKLLRKLGVPISEIRTMLQGTYTLGDGMRRHLITLQRDMRNLEQSILLCRQLQSLDLPVSQVDAQQLLEQMQTMEQGGAVFPDGQSRDTRGRYVAPVAVAALVVAFMAGMVGLLLWAYRMAPENAPPMGFLWLVVAFMVAVAAGVILALWQRIREIGKGEMDDAKKY